MGRKRYPMYISPKDDYVPDDYIGIYEIFTNPEYALPGYPAKEWCLSANALDKIRLTTYRDVKKRFVASGVPRFDKFWNGNLDAINDMGLNQFARLACFSELSTAMICFETTETMKSGNKRKFVSFGIKRLIYQNYYDSLETAIRTGEIPKKVNLYDRRKTRSSDVFSTPRTAVIIGDKTIQIGKNELFLMFERWCKLKDKKKSQAVYEAIKLLMEQNPVDGLGNVKMYERNIDIQKREVVLNIATDDYYKTYIKMPSNVAKMMKAIVSRYNSDPENQGKKRLSSSMYITQAVAAYNKRVPLKYSDPIAYREYLEIKEAQRYNEEVLSKNKGTDNP